MGRIGMSQRELRRVEVLARVKSKELKVVDAASLVGVSYRQAKRLWKRYREEGAKGLKHRSAGRRVARAKPARFRRRVMKLVRKKYGGVRESGLDRRWRRNIWRVKTVCRWMRRRCGGGCWRKGCGVGDASGRRIGSGESGGGTLGNWCRWTEVFTIGWKGADRGGCLMNMTDDATSAVELRLGEEETIWAAANMLRAWIEHYGVPQSLYVDWKNLYKRAPTAREQLRGEEPVTQFGRMCEKLGIKIIAAGSPQAKGRVERNHGTHQDRLIKKMRRKKIGTHERPTEFAARISAGAQRTVSAAAAEAEDYHRRAPSAAELREVFRLETERVIGNDWVVRYDNRLFQVQAQSRKCAPAQGKVVVCEWQDGTVEIEYRGQNLRWREIARAPVRPARSVPTAPRRPKYIPASDHPWRAAWWSGRARHSVAGPKIAAWTGVSE